MDGSTPTSADPDVQLLDELAGLGLALARDLSARALRAEDADEAAKLATAFHKVSRGVRQSIALKQKLARDQAAFAVEVEPQAAKQRSQAAAHRRDQLQRWLSAVLWDEYDYADDGDYHKLMSQVRRDLRHAAALDGFADEPFEAHLARLRAHYNPATWDFSDDEADPDPWGLGADSS